MFLTTWIYSVISVLCCANFPRWGISNLLLVPLKRFFISNAPLGTALRRRRFLDLAKCYSTCSARSARMCYVSSCIFHVFLVFRVFHFFILLQHPTFLRFLAFGRCRPLSEATTWKASSCSKAAPELQLGPTIRGASNWAHDTLQASQKLQNLQNASIPFNTSRAKRYYWHICTLHTAKMTWGLKCKYPAQPLDSIESNAHVPCVVWVEPLSLWPHLQLPLQFASVASG